MKKLIPFWPVAAVIFALVMWQCNPKDEKKPTTVIVVQDTTRIIDTTIIEPGDAPIADNALAKGKPDKKVKEKISCGFGYQKFNTRKRPVEEAPGGKKGKPVKPPVVQPPTDPPPTGSNNVIYINYFGKTVANTTWNTSGTFTVQDAGLAQSEIDYVTTQVKAHFAEYVVTITNDQAVFDSAAIGHKVEVVVTEDYQWYGQAGGVAYLNSFFWTDGSPAFVFSTLLSYNGHNIAEAIAHEAGHTLGLRHQSDCKDGVMVSQYNWGYQGAIGWVAPTMGASYQADAGIWFPDGPTPLGCLVRQNDVAILTSAVGKK